MLDLACLCGRLCITVDKRPDRINACNCTFCRKAGAHWAYYNPSDVKIEGATRRYCREDKADPNAELHFCGQCGSTTHFTLTPGAIAKFGNTLMGVNMRLADQDDLSGVELCFPDGQAWSGAGEITYVRASRIIGRAADAE